MAYLKILNGPQINIFFPLGSRKTTNVGRDQAMDLQLEDPQVSRKHFQVQLVKGRFVLVTFGKSGKTTAVMINDLVVNESQELVDNDQIYVGNTKIVFKCDDPKGEDAMYVYKDPEQRSIPTIQD